jgi:pilus assembly protein Flp/PilA
MIKSSISTMRGSFCRFLGDARGATSIEYAIIASGISIAIIGSIATLGSDVKNFYTSVSTALK